MLPFGELHHRSAENELKQMRILEDELMQGAKGSRLSKWIASSKNQDFDPAGFKEPEKLQLFGFIV